VLGALRQQRYAALSALMLLVATICVLLGVWQMDREQRAARLADRYGRARH
jgi:cytochrome oxidase assembly protein ShyY1